MPEASNENTSTFQEWTKQREKIKKIYGEKIAQLKEAILKLPAEAQTVLLEELTILNGKETENHSELPPSLCRADIFFDNTFVVQLVWFPKEVVNLLKGYDIAGLKVRAGLSEGQTLHTEALVNRNDYALVHVTPILIEEAGIYPVGYLPVLYSSREPAEFQDELEATATTAERYVRYHLIPYIYQVINLALEASFFAIRKKPVPARILRKLEKLVSPDLSADFRVRGQGGSEEWHDLTDFPKHYYQVRAFWRKAKSIFKRNHDWRKDVKEFYKQYFGEPFPNEHNDLIEWLAYPHKNDLLDEIMKDLSVEHLLKNDREIAYEHAARLCGAPKYAYNPSTLKNKV